MKSKNNFIVLTILLVAVTALYMPAFASSKDDNKHKGDITTSAIPKKPLTAQQVYKKCAPSIVIIKATIKNKNELSQGSGVVIHKGIVVSNYHVIKDVNLDEIHVFYNKKKYKATICYADPAHDLCSLSVKGLKAPPVKMGVTSEIEKGEKTYAIGAPEGFSLTISDGIVSGLRKIRDGTYIQTTAAISHGSSGGGLFDSNGKLIGITSLYIKSGQQLNFAYPVEWIKKLPDWGKTGKELAKESTKVNNLLALGARAYLNRDYKTALPIFKNLSKRGNSIAQFVLGLMYARGRGISQSYRQAVYWWKKSAKQGVAAAQNDLGFMFDNGKSVAQDYSRAVYWYKKAARQGDASGQYNLGTMYHKGHGVSQSYDRAVYWYKKSAKQGNANAQANLGVMYVKGIGVMQDYSQAIYWLKKAAKQRLAKAQSLIGMMYALGRGVSRNYAIALKWLFIAKASGDKHIQKVINVTKKQLNYTQIKKARRLADKWIKEH